MNLIKNVILATACLTTVSAVHADATFVLKDSLHHNWHNELVNYEVATAQVPARASLVGPQGEAVPVQCAPQANGKTRVSFIVEDLAADGQAAYKLTKGVPPTGSLIKTEDGGYVMDAGAGAAAARVPMPQSRQFPTPIALGTCPPPLLAVRGAGGAWLGHGRMAGTIGVRSMTTTLVADGPVYADVRTDYVLTDGSYSMNVRVVRNQDAVQIDEDYNTRPDAIDNAWFQFSANEGLSPERVSLHDSRVAARAGQVETNAGSDIPLDFATDHREASILGFVPWWPGTASIATLHGTKTNDTLSFLPRRIGQWRNPMGSYLETRKDGSVFFSLPLYIAPTWDSDGVMKDSPFFTGHLPAGWPETAGRRKWAFVASTTDKIYPAQGLSALAADVVRYRDLPLDKIKDWTFDWPWQAVAYPRLYVKPGTIAANQPDAKAAENELHGPHGILADMRALVSDKLLDGWGYVGYFAPNNAGPMGYLMRFDQDMGLKEATVADKTEMTRLMAFIAQMVYDVDWQPINTGFHLGNPNMPPRQEHHLAVASAALPTHPLATRWRARGAAEQERQMNDMVRPSGAWREGLHYEWDASMTPLLQAAVPLKLAGGYDVFANPKFKATWNYLVDALTPPSPRFTATGKADGRHLRVLPAFGHGSWEFMPLLGWIGAMTKDTDPNFSAHMMWAWQQQGSPAYTAMSGSVIDPALPSAQPALKSINYNGYGSILRSGFPSDDETWMTFRHGFNVEHFPLGDQGSFMLYAKGSPLVLQFGSQYAPLYQGAWFFNRPAIDHRPVTAADGVNASLVTPANDYQLGTEFFGDDPMSYAMHNKAFVSLAGADYSRGEQIEQYQGVLPADSRKPFAGNTESPKVDIPDQTWNRRVLFLKDPDPEAPNYFLLRDDFASPKPLPTQWNIWTLSDGIDTAANPAVVHGKYGVDLDVFMATPTAPQWSTREEGHTFLPGPSQPYLVTKPWKETLNNLRAEQAPGKSFLAVLYPRKVAEKAPTYQTLAEGQGVKVTTFKGTDWAFLADKTITWTGDGLSFTGTAGAIRKVGDKYTVVFSEPGSATVNGHTVTVTEPGERVIG